MLWTIFVVLLVLWFLGVVSSYTLGGFIHLLLVLAVIAVIVQLISGRRTVVGRAESSSGRRASGAPATPRWLSAAGLRLTRRRAR